jgi:hypothetical protein
LLAVMALLRLERTAVVAATSAAEEGRECPRCLERMPRDGRVCPHCACESEPWIYRFDRWWRRETGTWLWLEEARNEWMPHYYATRPASIFAADSSVAGLPAPPRTTGSTEAPLRSRPAQTQGLCGGGIYVKTTMSVRAPRKRAPTTRVDRRRPHRRKRGELFAYVLTAAVCIALAWGLANVQ